MNTRLILTELLLYAALLTSCKDAALPVSAAALTDTDTQTVFVETTETDAAASTDEVRLHVENILQMPELPNGCEIVSLTIALQYALNTEIDPVWLSDNYLPQRSIGAVNPEYCYVGDPKGYGLGCYAPCLQATASRYLLDAGIDEYAAKNISGSSMEELEAWVAAGSPVILWATLNMEPSVVAREWDYYGKTVRWFSGSHCVVLSGYTGDTSIVCDPLKGVVEYNRQDVIAAYELVGKYAMVLYQP